MKKVLYLCFMLFIFMFVVTPVFAEDITCYFLGNDLKIDEKIPDTVHTIILVLQIAIPILLVIFGSIDFVKAVTSQKEEEIKKGQQTFIKRLIAAIIVFFIVAIVKVIISFAAGSTSNNLLNCVDCFLSGTDDSNCKNAATDMSE